ncbi:MAG: glycoside hydrolase family 15 protein [Alphaproteobacteria bacterium]|nr:glycoside hydrolase family 15 protein [Alphaproteobacteria bacterium]
MSSESLDLAAIGNCAIAALIDREGRIVWWCMPRLDGDPVFCNLLAGNAEWGFADVTVADQVEVRRSYLRNTAILETVLVDRNGAEIRVTDFAPRFRNQRRDFRPIMLVRRIEPVKGRARIRLRIRPRFDYGATVPRQVLGSNHIRYAGDDMALRVTTDAPVSYIDRESMFVLDQPINLIFSQDESFEASISHTARDLLERTHEYWLEWVRDLAIPFEWQDAVIRAAITLKLCEFEETGAIVAALTTSLPEHANSGRNWDYRFCWLRDTYFVVHALNRLGATKTMEDYLGYIASVAASEPAMQLKPVYGIVPDQPLTEHVVEALIGYRGMGPVRVGNQAAEQVQNDVYGSVILAAAQMFFDTRLPRPGGPALFAELERLGEVASRVALEPDAGIWEFRGRARVHTHSAAMCWAGVARLAKIAAHIGLDDRAARWRNEAARIRKAILDQAWYEKENTFVDSFGGTDIDASLLLLQEIGFLTADDPRFAGTLATVERKLRKGRQIFRYDTPDDFGRPATSFTVCTFWYIDALVAAGRREEARSLFEETLTWRTPLGLMSEDLDPHTGELWGNFPQTYAMVGLINSAMRLSKTWEEAFWRGS